MSNSRFSLNPKIVAFSFLLLVVIFGCLLVDMGGVIGKTTDKNSELTQTTTTEQQRIANDIEGIEYVISYENEVKNKVEQNKAFKEIFNHYGKNWRFSRTPPITGTLSVAVIHDNDASWNIVGYKVYIHILDNSMSLEGNGTLEIVKCVAITLDTDLKIVKVFAYDPFYYGLYHGSEG